MLRVSWGEEFEGRVLNKAFHRERHQSRDVVHPELGRFGEEGEPMQAVTAFAYIISGGTSASSCPAGPFGGGRIGSAEPEAFTGC
jgi:hypothetical protein